VQQSSVLIVEDEKEIADFTAVFFQNKGWQAETAKNVKEAKVKQKNIDFDAIILDLNLGGERGEKIIQEIRTKDKNTPVVVTTAFGDLMKKIELFNLGADDYLVKPFEIEELFLRVEILTKKSQKAIKKPRFVPLGQEFILSNSEKKVCSKDKRIVIQLTKMESELLSLIASEKNRVHTNESILEKIWKSKPGYQSNVINATLARLKRKMMKSKLDHCIKTVKGVGIVFEN
jgi:DNA-binding response OmpR family regulator